MTLPVSLSTALQVSQLQELLDRRVSSLDQFQKDQIAVVKGQLAASVRQNRKLQAELGSASEEAAILKAQLVQTTREKDQADAAAKAAQEQLKQMQTLYVMTVEGRAQGVLAAADGSAGTTSPRLALPRSPPPPPQPQLLQGAASRQLAPVLSQLSALSRRKEAMEGQVRELERKLSALQSDSAAARHAQSLQQLGLQRSLAQAQSKLAAATQRIKQLTAAAKEAEEQRRAKELYTHRLERALLSLHKSLQQQQRGGSSSSGGGAGLTTSGGATSRFAIADIDPVLLAAAERSLASWRPGGTGVVSAATGHAAESLAAGSDATPSAAPSWGSLNDAELAAEEAEVQRHDQADATTSMAVAVNGLSMVQPVVEGCSSEEAEHRDSDAFVGAQQPGGREGEERPAAANGARAATPQRVAGVKRQASGSHSRGEDDESGGCHPRRSAAADPLQRLKSKRSAAAAQRLCLSATTTSHVHHEHPAESTATAAAAASVVAAAAASASSSPQQLRHLAASPPARSPAARGPLPRWSPPRAAGDSAADWATTDRTACRDVPDTAPPAQPQPDVATKLQQRIRNMQVRLAQIAMSAAGTGEQLQADTARGASDGDQ